MEGQRFVIVIHLNIAVIFADNFSDAFYSETVLVPVWFVSNQIAALCCKGGYPARVNNRYYNERCFFSFTDIYFNKRILDITGGL